MFYVYCLISEKNSKFHYFGFTSDLNKRLNYHHRAKVRTTNRFAPVKLLGYKTFETEQSALEFEKSLKRNYSLRSKFVKELEAAR